MPYLQVDLDALEEFEMAGALAGIGAGPFALGCLRLWRDCWRRKTEYVTADRLPAFFPGADERKLTVAMTSCRFLEASGTEYRVKGAAKRLGIRKAQQDAGKKHLKNLRQYAKEESETLSESPAGSSPGLPGDNPEVEPEETRRTSSGSTPALTANSQQPTANSKVETFAGDTRPPAPKAAKDSRLRPLSDRLVAAFAELGLGAYKHQGAKDTDALKRLLAVATPEEVEAAWRFGLVADGWLGVSTFAQLDSKWNDLRKAMKAAPSRNWAKGRVGAEEADKTKLVGDQSHGF